MHRFAMVISIVVSQGDDGFFREVVATLLDGQGADELLAVALRVRAFIRILIKEIGVDEK